MFNFFSPFEFETKIRNMKQFERCRINDIVYVVCAVPDGYIIHSGRLIMKSITEEDMFLKIKDDKLVKEYHGAMSSTYFTKQYDIRRMIFDGDVETQSDHQACFVSTKLQAAIQFFDEHVKEYKQAAKIEVENQIDDRQGAITRLIQEAKETQQRYENMIKKLRTEIDDLSTFRNKINKTEDGKLTKLREWNYIGSDDIYLVGRVYNHPTLPNGQVIRTSKIHQLVSENLSSENNGSIVIKTRNTTYQLNSLYFVQNFGGHSFQDFLEHLRKLQTEKAC